MEVTVTNIGFSFISRCKHGNKSFRIVDRRLPNGVSIMSATSNSWRQMSVLRWTFFADIARKCAKKVFIIHFRCHFVEIDLLTYLTRHRTIVAWQILRPRTQRTLDDQSDYWSLTGAGTQSGSVQFPLIDLQRLL